MANPAELAETNRPTNLSNDLLPNNYKIILVGLNKKQIETLPKNIIGIERTSSQEELAKYYTARVPSGEIAGYLGCWHIVDEAHITTIAVRKECKK